MKNKILVVGPKLETEEERKKFIFDILVLRTQGQENSFYFFFVNDLTDIFIKIVTERNITSVIFDKDIREKKLKSFYLMTMETKKLMGRIHFTSFLRAGSGKGFFILGYFLNMNNYPTAIKFAEKQA